MGRATQGVRIIKLREGDSIAAVAKVPAATDEEEMEEIENAEADATKESTETPETDNSEE